MSKDEGRDACSNKSVLIQEGIHRQSSTKKEER
jgi:hypothetical protein